jgi:hypothetical protein
MFRSQGLRIVNDYELAESGLLVTLDGFDPEAKVGYEYIAEVERGTNLNPSERSRLQSIGGILVIEATSAELLEEEAQRFLEGLALNISDMGEDK